MPSALLPVAEAQACLLALAEPVETERAALAQAAGRWAAENIAAMRTQPSADLSAMDGYAIRFADMSGPWDVIGESAAGAPFAGAVGAAQAVRIFTGAHLPPGADTILVQEDALREGSRLSLAGHGPAAPARHVRLAGLDFSEGETLISAGQRLTPAGLALAAMAGHGEALVRRPVRIAIAATGDELSAPGAPAATAQTPETNRLMLAAQLADMPVRIIDLGILPDCRKALSTVFHAVDADVLVTSGGASVGDHDLVRPALMDAGAILNFWRIAMRPGRPMMAGRMRGTIVIGLPGNPVSAFVTALLFVRPLIAHLSGAADPLPAPRLATLGAPLPGNDGREDYLRASLRDGTVRAFPAQDSSMLRTLAHADCLIIRPPHAPAAQVGDTVQILDIA